MDNSNQIPLKPAEFLKKMDDPNDEINKFSTADSDMMMDFLVDKVKIKQGDDYVDYKSNPSKYLSENSSDNNKHEKKENSSNFSKKDSNSNDSIFDVSKMIASMKEQTNKERSNKERSNKERSSKERSDKERSDKERSSKERSHREASDVESSDYSRSDKEKSRSSNTQNRYTSYQKDFSDKKQYSDSDDYDDYEGFDSEEDLRYAKMKMLQNLVDLAKKNIPLGKNYTLNSSYKSMKTEYEFHRSARDKVNGVCMLGKMLKLSCSTLDYLNGAYDPFGLNLKGLGESVENNISSYDDVLSELYDKYGKTTGTMAPEIKLLLMLGSGIVTVHMANTSLANMKVDSDQDILKRYPKPPQDRVNQMHMKAAETANGKIAELRSQEEAFMRDQEMLNKRRREINNLKNELSNMQSESQSHTGQQSISPPNIPVSFRQRASDLASHNSSKIGKNKNNVKKVNIV